MQAPPEKTDPIDLLDPAQVCERLGIDGPDLLALVNDARLAAYDLGGHIRFRASDVAATTRSLAAA